MHGRWNHLRDVAGGSVILCTATLTRWSSLFGWALTNTKPMPRWDVHLPNAGNRSGTLARVPRPLIAEPPGSAVSPCPSGWPVWPEICRPSLAPLPCFPNTDCVRPRAGGTVSLLEYQGRRPSLAEGRRTNVRWCEGHVPEPPPWPSPSSLGPAAARHTTVPAPEAWAPE